MQRRGTVIDDATPVWRQMIVFLLPLMASNILQSAGQTASGIYLGRMVGVKALAAVSSFFPILFFLISFLVGLSSGSTVLIGQAWGARNADRVRVVAGTTVTATLVIGVLGGLAGAQFARPLLQVIGTPADILPDSEAYSRFIFYVLPILFVYLAYSTFLRGVGDARSPFVALIASTAISVALAPALIAGWFGLPHFGILGPAIANAVASLVALAGLLVYLYVSDSVMKPDRTFLRYLRIDPATLALVLRIGLPTGVQLVLVSLAEIAVIAFVNRFGSEATAAYGAVNQVASYVQFPAISIGIAASIFGAQAIGARKPERLGRIARAGIALNYAIEGALIGLAYLFARPIIRLFITDEHVVGIAQDLLAITLWSYAIFGNNSVLSGLMRSSGAVLWPTLNAVAGIWLVEVPVAWWLSHGSLGLRGVWIAYPVAFIAILVLQVTYYRFVWKKRPIVALIPAAGETPVAT